MSTMVNEFDIQRLVRVLTTYTKALRDSLVPPRDLRFECHPQLWTEIRERIEQEIELFEFKLLGNSTEMLGPVWHGLPVFAQHFMPPGEWRLISSDKGTLAAGKIRFEEEEIESDIYPLLIDGPLAGRVDFHVSATAPYLAVSLDDPGNDVIEVAYYRIEYADIFGRRLAIGRCTSDPPDFELLFEMLISPWSRGAQVGKSPADWQEPYPVVED